MEGIFSLDVLRQMQGLAREPTRGIGNPLHQGSIGPAFGVTVHSNTIFPLKVDCHNCDKTGSGGDSSTYCQKCAGAGETLIEGIVRNGRETIIIQGGPLPRLFDPTFPLGVVAPPPLCRGLP